MFLKQLCTLDVQDSNPKRLIVDVPVPALTTNCHTCYFYLGWYVQYLIVLIILQIKILFMKILTHGSSLKVWTRANTLPIVFYNYYTIISFPVSCLFPTMIFYCSPSLMGMSFHKKNWSRFEINPRCLYSWLSFEP